MPDVPQDKIEQWLLAAKDESSSAETLFSRVEYLYIEVIAGIDWAESICGGLAAAVIVLTA
jgi:hypothetical protein